MVRAVECIYILMPLVQVAEFLVMNLTIDANTFDTILFHQTLNHRSDNFFVNLMNSKGYAGTTVVLCSPLVGKQVVTNARTLT